MFHYVTFTKHDHASLGNIGQTRILFEYTHSSPARLMAQTAAHELRDFYDGESGVSFLNGKNGPLWIVFVGSKSYGAFAVVSRDEAYNVNDVLTSPSFETMQNVVGKL